MSKKIFHVPRDFAGFLQKKKILKSLDITGMRKTVGQNYLNF